MVNSSYIKAMIEDNETKQYVLAKQLGISENSLSKKISNKRNFSITEMVHLMELLNIDFNLNNVKKYFIKEEA